MGVTAKMKMRGDGTPDKTADGTFILEDFRLDSDTQHFLAFCLQEGELILGPEFEECASYSETNVQSLCFNFSEKDDDDHFDISVWRNYIQNKYNVFPPKLGYDFMQLFYRYGINNYWRAHGGGLLACSDRK